MCSTVPGLKKKMRKEKTKQRTDTLWTFQHWSSCYAPGWGLLHPQACLIHTMWESSAHHGGNCWVTRRQTHLLCSVGLAQFSGMCTYDETDKSSRDGPEWHSNKIIVQLHLALLSTYTAVTAAPLGVCYQACFQRCLVRISWQASHTSPQQEHAATDTVHESQ